MAQATVNEAAVGSADADTAGAAVTLGGVVEAAAQEAESDAADASSGSEVDSLMAKYDNDEKQAAYLKSPEYKEKLKA